MPSSRLYMHSNQCVNYDCDNAKIIFESYLVIGQRFQFAISENQFLNLNDAVHQIKNFNYMYYGHFSLGHNYWLHYNVFDNSLYRESNEICRTYFTFIAFEEYMRHTHLRLLSLLSD